MNILAFETSSSACSIALLVGKRVFSRHEIMPQQHAHHALPWISALLDEAGITLSDLTALAYSHGPGSFTGIRISAALVQGIALAEDKRVIAIPTLQVISQGVYRQFGHSKVMVLNDAKMGQLYCGYYDLSAGLMKSLYQDKLIPVKDFSLADIDLNEWVLVTDLKDTSAIDLNTEPFLKVLSNYYPMADDVLAITKKMIRNNEPIAMEVSPFYFPNENYWKKTSG